MCQLRERGAIGANRVDLEVACFEPGEGDTISPRRPDGEVIPPVSQLEDLSVRQRKDSQPLRGSERAIDELLAIRGEVWESVVVLIVGDHPQARAVAFHDA